MKQRKRNGSDDGLLKDGTSRRARTTNRRGMSRIVWVAILVGVIGAVLLFRNQGGDTPSGIGERRSLVTVGADSVELAAAEPRSGDVDITAETRDLTPEQPAAGSAAAETPPPEPAPAPKQTKPAETKPAPKQTTPPPPPAPRMQPAATGGWVVQIGSYGEAENADRMAGKLREKGWDARVKVGNTSDGGMVHRVQIGYFASRKDADTFIRQNRNDLGGAIVVHR